MKKIGLFAIVIIGMTGCEKAGEMNSTSSVYPGYAATDMIGGGAPIVAEQYNTIVENPFVDVSKEATSTFSIDADGASYANVRRFLRSNTKPVSDAIRTEELVNYFPFNYPDPTDGRPIAVDGEVSTCPWDATHKLIRIGVKGQSIAKENLLPSNIVLLIDVSGSMGDPDKLALLKEALPSFVDNLRPQDKVAIVTYAGQAGVSLDATSGSEKSKIKAAISQLGAGGSTAGAQGIMTAYDIAEKNYVQGGNNRVILMTDGDFNVGPGSQKELVDLIISKRDKGIFLTTIGVGTGNLNDGMMEQVADKGNGNYEYIDNLKQAQKVFVEEFSKFYTVAQDVKIQLTFNPEQVKAYRLIGYENRLLNKEDFTDDKKDAGEINAGQTITALYEIVPAPAPAPDPVSRPTAPTFTINFRYKQPTATSSLTVDLQIFDTNLDFRLASENMRFAAAVASYGLLLRNSAYKGSATYEQVREWASAARRYDPYGYRQEFLQLIDKAKSL
ncbi:VWA domain-containing protein [Spirosoma sp. KNUC1025]|uniref:vWA domain-containing protein n=1 Tax=Spirosoma sp. KNUC1025 TaxID=2894082 RepID=UPI00386EC706|nr:VWA domain-containing protein [Spirosoma sp. KNUC1025]